MTHEDDRLFRDLEASIRARGVHVDDRIELLRKLADPAGADEIRERIEQLKQRIEDAASRVRRALR